MEIRFLVHLENLLMNNKMKKNTLYCLLVSLILINFGKTAYQIKRGDRIAQMIFAPVTRAQLIEVDDLDPTKRSAGGFGHTGVR